MSVNNEIRDFIPRAQNAVAKITNQGETMAVQKKRREMILGAARLAAAAALLVTMSLIAACASPGGGGETRQGLVGAWIVTVSRPGGAGKNLLTFSSDGTFFRSGDTHPVLSGAHGAWKSVGNGKFEATYIAFRFDQDRKWIGSARTRLQIVPGPGGDEFIGVGKVSMWDLQDKEIGASEVQLEGKRIQVEAF